MHTIDMLNNTLKSLHQLPHFMKDDPIVKYYNYNSGSVIKMIRYNKISIIYVYTIDMLNNIY